MFEKLYEKLPDTQAYLERLGLACLTVKQDLETLDTLLYAHVNRIPFENLDAWDGGRCPSLGVCDLFDKIILHRRGGWCHELNGLLHAFLQALGYKVYSVGCRVFPRGDFPMPIGHHGVICETGGKKYYCDVGFGDVAFQSAIALDGTPSPFGFHIEKNGDWYEICRDGDRPAKLLMFPDLALEPVDFLFANQVSATDPREHFRSELFVSIMRDEKRVLLRGDTLTEQGDGPRRVLCKSASRAELSGILRDYFGIDYVLK